MGHGATPRTPLGGPQGAGALCADGRPAPSRRRPSWSFIAGLLALLVASAGAEEKMYNDAELRAIFFNREKAETLAAPVVLLAHRTHAEIQGNGPRVLHEHRIWYVADPDDPLCSAIRRPSVLVDRSLEAFGLRRCRIYRGADTLEVAGELWQTRPPEDWPATGFEPWMEAHATLPPLRAGDIVELAYTIVNHWTRHRVPSDWERILIRCPVAPTIERHIVITQNRVLNTRFKVTGVAQRLRHHRGASVPKVELLTGDLPPGPRDAALLDGPHLLISAGESWPLARRVLAEHYFVELNNSRPFLSAVGDSLMRAHRESRQRLAAVFEHIEERCGRIPRGLLGSTYYPRRLILPYEGRAADPVDRALLLAALAQAATLKVDIFLGRRSPEGFDAGFVSPMQFDQLILRVLVAEEDRYVLVDAWAPDLESALRGVSPESILLGISDEWARLHEIDGRGELIPYEAE